jgi:hypothetical protein
MSQVASAPRGRLNPTILDANRTTTLKRLIPQIFHNARMYPQFQGTVGLEFQTFAELLRSSAREVVERSLEPEGQEQQNWV